MKTTLVLLALVFCCRYLYWERPHAACAEDDSKPEPKKKKAGAGEKKDEKSGDTEEEGKDDPKKDEPKLSIDESYVKDHLKEFLHPTSFKFLADGRARLVFDFAGQDRDMEGSFTPPISDKVQSNFRWRVVYENYGLRLGNRGMALLNCWFKDDLEAEIEYQQGINYSNRHTMALVFANDKGKAIGNNYGAQCAAFEGGAVKESRGKPEEVIQDQTTRYKLVVRGGSFEAHKDKRQRQTMAYSPRSFESGRVGFIWGGGMAGFVRKLEITGKLDAARLVKEIQKAKKN